MQHVTPKTLINIISLCDRDESSSQCLAQRKSKNPQWRWGSWSHTTAATGVLTKVVTPDGPYVGAPRPRQGVDGWEVCKGQVLPAGTPLGRDDGHGVGDSEDK